MPVMLETESRISLLLLEEYRTNDQGPASQKVLQFINDGKDVGCVFVIELGTFRLMWCIRQCLDSWSGNLVE